MTRSLLRRARAAGLGSYTPAVAALGSLCACRVAVRAIGFKRTERALDAVAKCVPPPASLSRMSPTQIGRLVSAVDRRSPGDPACLPAALACAVLLRLSRSRAVIHFGVRKAGAGGIQAHAWVTSDDTAVLGVDGTYAELVGIDAA